MDYVNIFKALSNGHRLKIMDLLSEEETCACELLDYFDFSQPTLSHHMSVLEKAGLIDGEKRGRWMYYSLNRSRLEDLADYFTQASEYSLLKEVDHGHI